MFSHDPDMILGAWHNYRPNYFPLQVALRIRPLKNDEKSRGYRCVAEKVDDRVRIHVFSGSP